MRDIWQLRRGPQDLPYSPQLLMLACAASVALHLAIARVTGSQNNVIGGVTVALAFSLAALYFFLGLRGLRNRFVQAASALVCCAIVFRLLTLPIALMIGAPPETQEQFTPAKALLVLAALIVIVWKIVVDAHVLRHTFDLPFAAGVVVTLLWWSALLVLAGLGGGL